MIRLATAFVFAVALLAGPLAPESRAFAGVLIQVDKSAQRMSVIVDGRARYHWPVSTGLHGGPPSGAFRPQRLERKWFSRTYDWAPMPYSIFFHHGFAIHGTNQISRIGRPASKGCVRLHPRHAATLFNLVKSRKAETRIVIGHGNAFARR